MFVTTQYVTMQPNERVYQRMEELACWFEENGTTIPNISRLIHKLRNNKQLGHLVNAEFVKLFHENQNYKITDVEASTDNRDVDIELDKKINIQTWHGQSTAGHIMEAQFDQNAWSETCREAIYHYTGESEQTGIKTVKLCLKN